MHGPEAPALDVATPMEVDPYAPRRNAPSQVKSDCPIAPNMSSHRVVCVVLAFWLGGIIVFVV